jgi:HAD superfamily phosphatase
MTAPEIIVFDVDGVLVEVTASYREAIRETVRSFTGELISNELIQEFKNQGGWNNDWELSYRFITDRGHNVTYNEVVDEFNRLFLGTNNDGLILKEEWLPSAGFFAQLQPYTLAIFTGRVGYELTPTLQRFAPDVVFDPIITADNVKEPKPAPEGLNIIKARFPNRTLWYLGDTIDDARAARDADVPFIGIAAADSPRRLELVEALKRNGAFLVISDVNELLFALAEFSAVTSPSNA